MGPLRQVRLEGQDASLLDLRSFEGAKLGPEVRRVAISPNARLILLSYPESGEQAYERYGVDWGDFDQLIGRLLTLADASFSDREQRKAFKDMTRQQVKEWVNALVVDASADAGVDRALTAPFDGGVVDAVGTGV